MLRRPVRATTPADVMDATLGAVTIGFVPVLGEIHAGHLALIHRSHQENDDTIVAIADPEGGMIDVPEDQLAAARNEGARIFYFPEPGMMYPQGFSTTIHAGGLTERWEGANGSGHFDRMTTLMAILLNQLQPTRTYVGEKYLQLVGAIRRMHRDLSLPGEIVVSPTVRDPDGLPTSAGHASLSQDQRVAAQAIPNALFAIQQRAMEGETGSEVLEAVGREIIAAHPELELEYLAIVDPETFEPIPAVRTGARAIAAGTVGTARILDNVHLTAGTSTGS